MAIKKYDFSKEDKAKQSQLRREVARYGFYFSGDEKRPRGVYSNDGQFYGDDGKLSESHLAMDEANRISQTTIDGLLKGLARKVEGEVAQTEQAFKEKLRRAISTEG